MAPALIEAAGVASRERQSTSCNKTQPVCLAGKRLFDLKQHKYLLREAKISTRDTLLTCLQPRVVLSADGTEHTTTIDCRPETSDKSQIEEKKEDLKPALNDTGTGDVQIDRRGVFLDRSAMNNSDNGHTWPAVEDDSCSRRSCMMRQSSSTSTEGKSQDQKPLGVIDSDTLLILKQREDRHHEKFKDLEQRIELLSKRVRTVQCQRLSTYVAEQLRSVEGNELKTLKPSKVETKESSVVSDGTGKVDGREGNEQFNDLLPLTLGIGNVASEDETGEAGKGTEERLLVLLHRSKLGESLIDPDATESETEDDEIADRTKLKERKSESLWWKDRALIGSRGSWLESRISDIDQKLKKYEDILRLLYSKRTPVFDILRGDREKEKSAQDESGTCIKGANNQRNIDALRKNGLLKSLMSAPPIKSTELSLPEDSCSRTLPLQSMGAHRYLRSGNTKVEKPNYLGYTCPSLASVDPCSACQKPKVTANHMVSGNARAAALDHSYHAKLSFENDILLSAHLESTVRKGGLDTKIKPITNKIVARKREPDKKRSTNRSTLSNLVAAAKASKIKLSGRGLSQSLPAKLTSKSRIDTNKKRSAALSAANQIEKKASKLTLPRESTPRNPSTSSEQSNLTQSQSAAGLSQLVKRKRPSSAFDINNIVIPYSIACATRVEKLKYKEIPTPGWRSLDVVENFDDVVPELKVPRIDREISSKDEDQEQESTSDEVYALRHIVCELEERKRFSAFFQPLRRSRSTRQSSECNTPEPHSPTSNDEGRSIVSSISTPTDVGHSLGIGDKSEGRNLLWMQLKPEENAVPPWPKRTFPLSADEEADLEAPNSPSPDSGDEQCKPKEATSGDANSGTSSKQLSPCSLPSSSPLPPDDTTGSDGENFRSLENNIGDEDDESWTVKLVSSEKTAEPCGKNRKGIVLKLAKK